MEEKKYNRKRNVPCRHEKNGKCYNCPLPLKCLFAPKHKHTCRNYAAKAKKAVPDGE